MHEASRPKPIEADDETVLAPEPDRVARTTLALTALSTQAVLEQEVGTPEADETYRDLIARIDEIGIGDEFEPGRQSAVDVSFHEAECESPKAERQVLIMTFGSTNQAIRKRISSARLATHDLLTSPEGRSTNLLQAFGPNQGSVVADVPRRWRADAFRGAAGANLGDHVSDSS
jgi:hypothetical protein